MQSAWPLLQHSRTAPRAALTSALASARIVRVVLDAEPDNVAAMYVTMPDRQGMEVGFEALTDLQLLRG